MYLKEPVVSIEEIKKSKFITLLFRVCSAEQVKDIGSQVKKNYPQATHYCTAWIIGNLSHSSDDGEPSGTAGRPMLDVLKGSGADQILAVVVRYFGGTLLGKGGLVRAYSHGVAAALEQAQWKQPAVYGFYQLEAPFSLAGKVESTLHGMDLQNLHSDYGSSHVLFSFLCEQDPVPSLMQQYGGQIHLAKTAEKELEI